MKNSGTLVGAPVRPNDSNDLYPVALQSEIKGGHHSRDTTDARDAIPAHLREAGMTCYVKANGNTYVLENDLTTWTLDKTSATSGGGPGSGGDSETTQIISGNFGVWTPLDDASASMVNVGFELRYKADLQAFPSRSIVYLQGQFALDSSVDDTTITLGNLPENCRPENQLRKYFICQNVELFLVIETGGDVKIVCKDAGATLPVDSEDVADQPMYIDCFFKPVIADADPEVFTAHREGDFTRNNCDPGKAGTTVTFSKDYTSTIDQDTADAIADANFDTDGQNFANDPENGATCEVVPDSLFIYNGRGKTLWYSYEGGPENYISNFSGQTLDQWGSYGLRMDFGPGSDTVATYWLFDPATYDQDDPSTYETGTLGTTDYTDIVIEFGQQLYVQETKPNFIT